ncbi:DUF309 domain-containing protein [Bacillus horti]|uniref:Metal-dependent hydrolase n=1 Tax=Caldalkalibacillus horti TaxID=77523 RepID=A0ABT9VV26_9BACI|nr:DUF309 domain-containing protein [Bacillus horti]MDQ0164831.1 putative metal-dependent hydrolase [Bacillus horti]
MNYSYLYLLFLYYFNYKRDYYECHDVLEELWFETQRDRFYQGLLQVAVGLYHYRWNNPKGSILLFEGAVEKLQPYPEYMRGIHVGKIRKEAEEYLYKLRQLEEHPFDFYDLTIDITDEELQLMVDSIHKEVEERS